MAVDAESVLWAYRLFLDREPEDESYAGVAASFESHEALREYFLSSAEFLSKYPRCKTCFKWAQRKTDDEQRPSKQINIRGYHLDFPDDHRLSDIQAAVPTYDKLHDPIFAIVGARDPKGVFIDVGANVGDTAAIMRANASNPIICVEGSATYVPFLRKNISALDSAAAIDIVDKFLFCESLKTLNLTYSSSTGSGGFRSDAPEEGAERATPNTTVTIDALLKQHALHPNSIALFKTDTDGLDAFILCDALNAGLNQTVLFFECDLHLTVGGAEGIEKWQAVLTTMCRNDYSFIIFDNLGLPIAFLDETSNIKIFDSIDYISNQYMFKHVYIHYLDVWAFPPSCRELFTAACAAYRGRDLRKYVR